MTVQGLERFISPDLTESEIDELLALGPDAVRWVILEFGAQLKDVQGKDAASEINTPSGQIPVYEKSNVKKHRRGKVGAKDGHAGRRRAAPERIDEVKEHALEKCPCCGEALEAAFDERERITEDIPEVKSVVTKYIIKRYRCKHCGSNLQTPSQACPRYLHISARRKHRSHEQPR